MRDVDDLKLKVKAKLKPSRYRHTIGVLKFAVKLAETHHVDESKAKVAALLHDYCKYESDENILNFLKEHTIEIHPVILNKPNLGHGLMASILVKEAFGIEDTEITNAICHHTFGRLQMSKLEKIIYLADSLEENRQYEGVESFRETALQDLDKALFLVSSNTLIYELSRGHMVHENTVLMRNAYLEDV